LHSQENEKILFLSRVLGVPVTNESPIWCILKKKSAGSQLRVKQGVAPLTKPTIEISALISLIYENTLTPTLTHGFTPKGSHNSTDVFVTTTELDGFDADSFDQHFLESLTPHVTHATSIAAKQQLADHVHSIPAAISFFDLPVPICLLSKNLDLLQINHHAEGMLSNGVRLPRKAEYALAIEQRGCRKIRYLDMFLYSS
jgi:hypothetical protein